MSLLDRWEHGSDFHLQDPGGCFGEPPLWNDAGVLFGSGRDALRAILSHGKVNRRWSRLWIPSYFCQDVVVSLIESGVQVEVYHDSPIDDTVNWERLPVRSGDVILRVNYLGLRHLGDVSGTLPPGVEVIDDHTHDPFSGAAMSTAADWCVASLRKTLPLPDGGVLWSPASLTLPAPPPSTSGHTTVAMKKLAAMALKAAYLAGGDVEKSSFRELYQLGEGQIGSGAVSGMSPWAREMLRSFPISNWRDQRRRNHSILSAELSDSRGITVLQPGPLAESCPFCVTIVCDSASLRASIRRALIAECVYPAILWPLEERAVVGVRDSDIDLSRRILCLHCDMRYTAADMLRVAKLVRAACDVEAGRWC